MSERLDAILAHAGHGTRSAVKELVRRGRVQVDGVVERDPGRRIAGQPITLDGEPVSTRQDATLIVHKPIGHACSRDPDEEPLIDELYPDELAHLPIQPAGRLDRETSGLIICTTDGALIRRLTDPRKHVAKRYRIRYQGVLADNAERRCEQGFLIDGDEDPTLPSLLVRDGPGSATMVLHEGRYHQVRRMIAALGGFVTALHRDRIGRLDLPADLAAGAARELTADELALALAHEGE